MTADGARAETGAQRVVSLCPSITETVVALGRLDSIVGRTRYCVHPARELRPIPHVRGTKNPDLARILDLRPDLVLMNEEENRREDAERLRAAGLRVESFLPRTALDAARDVRRLGRLLDVVDTADTLAREIRLRARRRKQPIRRVLVLIWKEPWMAVSAGTYLADLLDRRGLAVVTEGPGTYPALDENSLRNHGAEAVLLPSEPWPWRERDLPAVAAATGLPRSRILLVDGKTLTWHGASTIDGLAEASRIRRCLSDADRSI